MTPIEEQFLSRLEQFIPDFTLNEQQMRQLRIFYENLIEWNKVMEKVTTTQIETLIHQGIRKGTWDLLSNGSVKILYKYGGQIIVITGKVVNNIFRIGDAWVWNGIGTP